MYNTDNRRSSAPKSRGGNERRPFGKSGTSDRPFRGNRKPFSSRNIENREGKIKFGSSDFLSTGSDARSFDNKGSDNNRRSFSGERKSFGGPRNDSGNRRPFGERKFGGDRRESSGGSRFGGERRSFGGNRSGGGRFGGGPRRFGGNDRPNRTRISGTKMYEEMFIQKAEVIEEEEKYVPTNKFSDFKISDQLKKNITSKKYTDPSPIQDEAIPQILEGKDLIGIANTGTGKTAAFLIPLIEKVLKNQKEKVLILVPTRELALQIDEEFRSFAKFMNMFSVLCIGGESIRRQKFQLERRYNFLIGTPGRIKDLMNQGAIKMETFTNIVLDEVDRMMDMGFIDDMKYIIAKLPKERQSLFFSATMERSMEPIIHSFLKDPVKVSVKKRDTSKNVDQDVIKVGRGGDKVEKLHDLLIKEESYKVLIFTRTKIGADKLFWDLKKRGFQVEVIHGDKTQMMRKRAIINFKTGRMDILIATDVAARGLDIPNVTHVINYDQPNNYEDYIHRIGRTGRAGKTGKALTFV